MRSIFYLFVPAAALLVACGSNTGYTITGTVAGAADGDVVYLSQRENREIVNLDSAIISNGAFKMKGDEQADVKECMIVYHPASEEAHPAGVDLFLENGQIQVTLDAENGIASATGTPNNDIYQPIRDRQAELMAQMKALDEQEIDPEDTEAVNAKVQAEDALEEQMADVAIQAIPENITNPVGIYLLKRNYYQMDVDQVDGLLQQLPEGSEEDTAIARIIEVTAQQKATGVGQAFTDFEMNDPEGKPVKLSDYVGKGKVVLVDFWASWCPPCRAEMPSMVELYAKYKKTRKFEIVGVSLDRDADSWKNGIETLNITWPQMSDVQFWNCEGAKLYGVSSIPHTVLIDKDGVIAARNLHGEELQAKIDELLK
ncbi:MAG: AhpC/TSA family protein [Prevotellaceae bacterium]|nr:AhpC/TSA family protein [Prevotellaceae bacterium]